MPPPLKIRAPQRIVSLQYLYDQIAIQCLSIEAARCGAADTILREPYKVCFKYIKRHAAIRFQEKWRMLSNLSIRQNP